MLMEIVCQNTTLSENTSCLDGTIVPHDSASSPINYYNPLHNPTRVLLSWSSSL